MAILQIVGNETGDASEYQNSALSGTASIQSSVFRSGGYALRCNPTTTNTGFGRILGNDSSTGAQGPLGISGTVYLSGYFRWDTKPASGSEVVLRLEATGNSRIADLRLKSSGVFELTDRLGTVLATGTATPATTTWVRLELEIGHGSSTTYVVRVDDTTDMSGSGADFSTSNCDEVSLGKVVNNSGQSVDFYYDDWVIADSSAPPDGRILNLAPTGDGTYTAWTIGAGSGSDYQNIDEIPPDDDTTYLLSTAVLNDASTATLQTSGAVGINGTVHFVKAWLRINFNGSSNGNFQVRFRSNTTDSNGTSVATVSAYRLYGRRYATDPATSSAWTVTGLDTLECGAVCQTTNVNAKQRLTAVGAMVFFLPDDPVVVTPDVASLTLTTFAPEIPLVSPPPAALTITGYAPIVQTPIIPFIGNLVLTTYAPVVSITASTPVITGSVLQIDWNDDGDFSDTGEDVTARLISTQPLTCVRGKDQLRLLAPPMAGAFNCELDNRSRDYSVENASSPLFANLHPGHKLRATLTATSTDYTIFTGILDDLPQHPEFGRWTVEAPALGSLSRLRGKRVSTELLENVTIDEAMNAVLDAAGWLALERSLQVGLTTLDFYWTDNEDAFDAIATLLLTEGPGASVYEDAVGNFIFENRHSRITQVRSTTSQFTFTDQDYILTGYQYDSGIKDIINQVEVGVTTRTVKESDFVWQYGKPLILGPSETRVIRAVASDPFKDAITPDPNSGVNAVQLLSILGTAPQIRLSFRDEQTGDIGSSGGGPTASSIQTALEALSTISPGDVSVTLFASAPDVLKFDITWQGNYAHMPVELLGVSVVSLTGKAIEAKVTDKTVGVVDDYDLLAGALVSLTMSATSGQSIELTFVADAGGAYIDNLQLRAKLVSTDSTKRFLNTLDASDSITKYGLHPYSPSIRTEISEEQAIQLADNIVRYYKDPRAMAVFPVAGTDGTIQLQQLTREISDCITIVDAQTGVNRTWFIERIAHRITEGPHIFTEFGCEAVLAGTIGGPGGGGGDVAIVGSAIVGTSTVGA